MSALRKHLQKYKDKSPSRPTMAPKTSNSKEDVTSSDRVSLLTVPGAFPDTGSAEPEMLSSEDKTDISTTLEALCITQQVKPAIAERRALSWHDQQSEPKSGPVTRSRSADRRKERANSGSATNNTTIKNVASEKTHTEVAQPTQAQDDDNNKDVTSPSSRPLQHFSNTNTPSSDITDFASPTPAPESEQVTNATPFPAADPSVENIATLTKALTDTLPKTPPKLDASPKPKARRIAAATSVHTHIHPDGVWTSHLLTVSLPVHTWGETKRWQCCQCNGETIVENRTCACLNCGHERCIGGCAVLPFKGNPRILAE